MNIPAKRRNYSPVSPSRAILTALVSFLLWPGLLFAGWQPFPPLTWLKQCSLILKVQPLVQERMNLIQAGLF